MEEGSLSFQPYFDDCSRGLQDMTLNDAQVLPVRLLKQVMEEKLDQHNVQLAQASTYLLVLMQHLLTRTFR